MLLSSSSFATAEEGSRLRSVANTDTISSFVNSYSPEPITNGTDAGWNSTAPIETWASFAATPPPTAPLGSSPDQAVASAVALPLTTPASVSASVFLPSTAASTLIIQGAETTTAETTLEEAETVTTRTATTPNLPEDDDIITSLLASFSTSSSAAAANTSEPVETWASFVATPPPSDSPSHTQLETAPRPGPESTGSQSALTSIADTPSWSAAEAVETWTSVAVTPLPDDRDSAALTSIAATAIESDSELSTTAEPRTEDII
eukprot:1118138-Rhodomonas_salina.1